MPFKLLTLLQFTQIISLYILITVCLPAWVFHKKLSGFSLSVRLLLYYVIGNFFAINLAFLLQMMHISNRMTLALCTAAAAAIFGVRNNELQPAAVLKQQAKSIELVLCGKMGYRTFLLKVCKNIRKHTAGGARTVRNLVRGRVLDFLLAAGVTALFFWRFGANLLNVYGYCASDMIVHNYWVNALGEGKLFVAGVYPFGFHCLMYYLHELSGIDNYVLLRIFWIVQTLMVFYSLLVFLKVCCKNRYLPYLGVSLYVYGTCSFLAGGTYWRFFSSLPQSFGMVFILPAVLFLFLFFERKKDKMDGSGAKESGSLWCLAGFTMCLALAISIHFYNAMIIGLFCVGGIVGYGFRLFRKKYFARVIAAGLIGVTIAALPMVTAVVTGTKLEGSLNWGKNIIRQSLDNKENKEEADQEVSSASDSIKETGALETGQWAAGIFEGALSWAGRVNKAVEGEFKAYIIRQNYHEYIKYLMYLFYALPFAGVLFWILGSRDYGARIVTTGISLWLHGILIASGILGVPTLMDAMRASSYVTLALIAGTVLLADALLYGLTGWLRRTDIRNIVALPILAAAVYAGFATGVIYDVHTVSAYEMNEAVVCLTNIIHENKDKTWTILSANDERQMADDHGYHYEIIDFLREMEHWGDDASVTIPTPYVYIFIEKTLGNYESSGYGGIGQSVSEKRAVRALPTGSGINVYQLENRWILMSRMYYWAKEFQKLYPNEFKVYYETDNFVCYCLEQNTYSLYNLAIDYGYNMQQPA